MRMIGMVRSYAMVCVRCPPSHDRSLRVASKWSARHLADGCAAHR
ncbi:hypothetical protein XOC_0658 [Xanthomonas oryzae pv. oryzicola BLS256]|uniref:Uncharacterized protein n=1 Tax=Xanthomonas oryzae pv. oryzicola (strain BLS256) TaxID=383407 RepID=G7TBI6_XANOB|nr:hypothetical protein XOC_0658 [Xanthomonas oryzae pv. oryzicola BLS256]QEO99283.1 hypothetical protein XOCgx_4296 [Xanthomonas oryzae pv. oryzicola]